MLTETVCLGVMAWGTLVATARLVLGVWWVRCLVGAVGSWFHGEWAQLFGAWSWVGGWAGARLAVGAGSSQPVPPCVPTAQW